jgi:hypothetical protein
MKSNKRFVTIALLTCFCWAAIIVLSGKSFQNLTWREMSPLFGILIILGIKELKDLIIFLKSTNRGIDLINNGFSWNTHYLIISKNPIDEKEIFVTNDLLWIEENNKKSYSDEILLKILTSDFEKIAKKSQLKYFLRNRKVIYKLTDHRYEDE